MNEAPSRARCCPRGRPGIGGRDHGELSPPFAGKLRLRNDRDCHCTIDVSTPQQIEASHFLPSVLTLRPRPSSNQPLAAGDYVDHTTQLQSPLRTILTVGMDGTSSSSRLPEIPFLSRMAPACQSQFLFKCIREQVGKGNDAPALEAFETTLETRWMVGVGERNGRVVPGEKDLSGEVGMKKRVHDEHKVTRDDILSGEM